MHDMRIVSALGGGWMVLVRGFQWAPDGEPDASGAYSKTWGTRKDALGAYVKSQQTKKETTMNTTTTKKTTTRTKKTKQTLVIIAWVDGWSAADSVSTLGYNNGKGGVRVYEKDNYDGRVDLGCPPGERRPFFDNAREALLWMAAHRDQQIQLSVSAARDMGFSKSELADL
jgi:hypothetical protein